MHKEKYLLIYLVSFNSLRIFDLEISYQSTLNHHPLHKIVTKPVAHVMFLPQCLCIWCVLRLYHLLRAGVTWKGAAPIELWLLPPLQPSEPQPRHSLPCESTLLLGGAESDTDASLHELWREKSSLLTRV